MNVAIALVMLAQAPQIAGGTNITEQIACAPLSLPAPPTPALRVSGGYVHGRIMFGPGEPLVINAGSAQGIEPGQQYFVRRYVRDRYSPVSAEFHPNSIHTAGWVTIVNVQERTAVATVTHACDGVIEGDYLEPFTSPVVPAPAAAAQPDFAHPGRIVMADEKRQMGYAGLVMLFDRGSEHGVRAGQVITIYREAPKGDGPTQIIGEATVLNVYPRSSVVRIDASKDAIFLGDLAAIHRITQ